MASPSSRTARGKSGSHSRHHRLLPVSTASSRLMHAMPDSTHNVEIDGAVSGAINSDSSAVVPEMLKSTPDLGTSRAHDALIFSFNESPPSRSPFYSYGQSAGTEKVQGHYDSQYLPEATPQSMGGPSFQSTSSGTNSPLTTIHDMQQTRPPYYSMPMANCSQERIDDDELQMLLTSTSSDTPPFHLSHTFEHGGSPSTDPNALHSDSESHGFSHQVGDAHTPKSGYRREIEAKSRNKIRLASQRLRNVISPNMRPGVSLRGAADVMEEAADQIRRLSNRMRDMEAQIQALRSQLDARQQTYDARMMH